MNSGSRSYSSYRFSQFFNAIKAKYPNITVFSSTVEFSPKPRGAGQDYHQYTVGLTGMLKPLLHNIGSNSIHQRPDYLVSQFNFFDQYERGRPTIIGEYAAIQDNSGRVEGPNWNLPRNKFPSWIGAVGEAVFLLGAERNSDRVFGTCYAPLLQNLNSYQWAVSSATPAKCWLWPMSNEDMSPARFNIIQRRSRRHYSFHIIPRCEAVFAQPNHEDASGNIRWPLRAGILGGWDG